MEITSAGPLACFYKGLLEFRSILLRHALQAWPNLGTLDGFVFEQGGHLPSYTTWSVIGSPLRQLTHQTPNASNASLPLAASVATLSLSTTQSGRARDSSPAITHSGFRHYSCDAAVTKRCPPAGLCAGSLVRMDQLRAVLQRQGGREAKLSGSANG